MPRIQSTLSRLAAGGLAILLLAGACNGKTRSEGSGGSTSPVADSGTQNDTGSGEYDATSSVDDSPSPFTQCTPGDVSSFHPSWHPPATPQMACTEAELDDVVADCFETASTTTACNAFQEKSPACWTCMVTPDSNAAWGPIIASSVTHLYYGNFAGCLALETGDGSATGCASKQQAARVCSEFACSGPNCPAFSPTQLNAISACTSEALDTNCASFQAAAVTCAEALLLEGGAGEAAEKVCSAQTYGDLPTYYRALGPIFCGAPVADAGIALDAAADGD